MNSVYVLGKGQLGRMLRQAGEPLGIRVSLIGEDTISLEKNCLSQSTITAEIESWPKTAITSELSQHPAFMNRDCFTILADRLTQKCLLDKLALPVTPWLPLSSKSDWPKIFEVLGSEVILKKRVGSYDGRGQWHLTGDETDILPENCYGNVIAEQKIPFISEISLIGARTRSGEACFYPLIKNLHQQGILRASVALPTSNTVMQKQAEEMLSSIMQSLDYIGVMAMECFLTPSGLLINELAPRVHNSGHWTQNGATVSQFELHLRAILDLPLPSSLKTVPSVMINLIGTELCYSWLREPLVNLHWYEKKVLPGRKVGHLNLCDTNSEHLAMALDSLAAKLPADYQQALSWASVSQAALSLGS